MVSMWSVVTPGSTLSMRAKLLMTSKLAERSTTASASCATASAVRVRAATPPVRRAFASRSASCGSRGASRQAGSRPTSTVVTAPTMTVAPSTVRSIVGGRDEYAANAAGERQQRTFGDERTRDAPATRAEGGAHGDLAAARQAALEQEV